MAQSVKRRMDHVIYFVSSAALGAAKSAEAALEATARRLSPQRARQVRFQVETSVPRTLAKLRAHGADALFIDARGEGGVLEESSALALLRALFPAHEVGGPVGREQSWLVVGDDERGAALAFEAGRARVAGVVAGGKPEHALREVWERVERTVARQRAGKIAVCLAGGGIEGLFYELGALRALSAFLPDFSFAEADILCGISAGAILAAFLANGVTPREVARGLEHGEGKLDRIRRREIFDPNWREIGGRSLGLAWETLTLRHSPLSALWRLPPSGMFAGEGLRGYLARQLAKPGMTDRFDELPRALYIGATDQDTSEHVVFGEPGRTHVPISTAVRASSALTPFYAPQQIDGRYYIDGGFTRTTNMRVAVQAGATLVILVDPLVPVYSEQPGYVAGKGAVFGAAQGMKSLIHSRFDKAVNTLREMYPHVAFHLFSPDGASMKAMSGSPMKYFYRPGIEQLAYEETVRDIRTRRLEQLARDFRRHDVRFVDPETDLGEERRDLLEVADVRVA